MRYGANFTNYGIGAGPVHPRGNGWEVIFFGRDVLLCLINPL